MQKLPAADACMQHCGQELKVFLEAEGPLGSAPAWQSLQPLQGSLLEGVARLPKQLLGGPHLCLR